MQRFKYHTTLTHKTLRIFKVLPLLLLVAALFSSLCFVVARQASAAGNDTGAYASWDDADKTLTISYGSYTPSATEFAITNEKFTSAADCPWKDYASQVETVKFNYLRNMNTDITHFSYWFAGMTSLKKVNMSTAGLLATRMFSNIEDMNSMFEGDTNLQTLQFPINSQPDEMTNAFAGCTALESIRLSRKFRFKNDAAFPWDTKVENLYWATTNQKMGTTAEEWNAVLASISGFARSYFVQITLCNSEILLNANGGSFNLSSDDTESTLSLYGKAGESFSYTAVNPSYLAHTFKGWSLSSEEGSALVDLPTTFPVDAVTTYYAQWSDGGAYAYYKDGILTFAYGTEAPQETDIWGVSDNDFNNAQPLRYASSTRPITFIVYDKSLFSGIDSIVKINSFVNYFSGIAATNIVGLANLPYDTNDLNFQSMFYNSDNLRILDLSGIQGIWKDTSDSGLISSNFTDIFSFCTALTTLDMSGFTSNESTPLTSKVSIFNGCDSLCDLTMTNTAGYVAGFPLSSDWQAYYNGGLVDPSSHDFSDQTSVDNYFQSHDGITRFVKMGQNTTIQFAANGGAFDTTTTNADSYNSVVYNKQETLSQNGLLTLAPQPTREGYKFLGWADTDDATTPTLDPSNLPKLLDAKVSYYAVWQELPKATFTLEDGATWKDGSTEAKTVYGEKDSLIPAPDNAQDPTRAGYTFIGWSSDKTAIVPNYTAGLSRFETDAVVYYAIWKQDSTLYNASFTLALDEAWATGTSEKTLVTQGYEACYIPAPDSGFAPLKSGYIFNGWIDENNPDISYIAGYSVFSNHDVSYKATWRQATEAISITFDAGSGSWTNTHTVQVAGTAASFVVAPVSPEYADHTLIGWLSDTGAWLSSTTTFEQAQGHVYTAQYVESLGWHQNENGWYYIYDLSNNYYTNCWALINSAWFYFNDAGYCLEYQWGYINGEWYFFGWGGYMQTGWNWLGGSWYFLDRNSGAMQTGWVHDGVWYYCDAALGGAMYDNCWAYINGEWYGFNEGGSMTQGWSYSYAYNGWFYLDPETGHMLYGWQYIGGHWYYFYDNGVMAVNIYVGTYWLGSDGAMW